MGYPKHHYKRALHQVVQICWKQDGAFNDRVAVVTEVTHHTMTIHPLMEDGKPYGGRVLSKSWVTYLKVTNWEEIRNAETQEILASRAEKTCSRCGSQCHETGECIE